MKHVVLALFVSMIFVSCKDLWPAEDKAAFKNVCLEGAQKWATNDTMANAYCDCVLEKMIKKYPFETEALDHLDELAKDTALLKCKDEILKKYNKK